MATTEKHYSHLRFLHIPTGKTWTCNGAGGIVNVQGDSPIPMWLTENSKDWEKLEECKCDGRDMPTYVENGKRWCPQCGYEVL